MNIHPLTRKHWYIVALVATVGGLLFIAPYLSVVALAALMAFLFYGFYARMVRRMRPGLAASLTFLFSLAVLVIPVALIGVFALFQIAHLSAALASVFGDSFTSLPATAQSVIDTLNRIAAPIAGTEQAISVAGIVEFLRNSIPAIVGVVAGFITELIGGIPAALVFLALYVFLFYEFLVYSKRIISTVVAISPFEPEITRAYLTRVGLMANAMAKGQLVISFIIAALSAVAIAFFLDLWQYLLLMTVVFTLFNLVPLGAGIIIYPMLVIAALLGDVWPAIGGAVAYTLISNVDTILRPRFIPRSITLSNALTMLAVFGGIGLYGLLGVVYGPIIMIIIVTSVQMYLEFYRQAKNRPDDSGAKQQKIITKTRSAKES